MKVLLLNGSPKASGNTARSLEEMVKIFREEGIEAEIVQVGNQAVRGCVACGYCYKEGKCAIDDVVNELAVKLQEADGLVVGSPVYYASSNATVNAFLDRLFYSTHFDKRMKVGASIAVARRSLSLRIVRHAIIPGIAHPVPMIIGITDFPERPTFLNIGSSTTVARAI